MTGLLGRTEEEGRQEVGICSLPRAGARHGPGPTVDPSPATAIPTDIRLTEPRLSDSTGNGGSIAAPAFAAAA